MEKNCGGAPEILRSPETFTTGLTVRKKIAGRTVSQREIASGKNFTVADFVLTATPLVNM